MTELVHYELRGTTAFITLDSPTNRNALSNQLVLELAAHIETAIADASVQAAVIAAEGPVFCAGADLKERGRAQADDAGPKADYAGLLARIMTCDLPFIARVHGPVRAGGTGLVAACDIAIADSKVSFAIPEVHLGVVPAVISVPLSRILDRRAMHRYCLTGETFDAAEAARIGLVSLATDDIDATLDGILASASKGHPGAVRRTKRLLDQVEQLDLAGGFQLTAELSAAWFATPDAKEGMKAVMEKRAPSWRGAAPDPTAS